MGILDEIVRRKRESLSLAKSAVSLKELTAKIPDAEKPRDFKGAIKRDLGCIRLIAEIKKASPSKGIIKEDFDPAAIARIYEEKADAISVLTEEDFFQGELKYIKTVKEVSQRPVLRKDFIFDEYQIYESRAAGADAILLIGRILDKSQAAEYLHMAGELGMAVLFEVHDFKELELTLKINAPIIGINNRNLDTLKIDLNTIFLLKKEITGDRITVSESGIDTPEDVKRLEDAGVDAMLVGTALMSVKDIGKRIDELYGKSKDMRHN